METDDDRQMTMKGWKTKDRQIKRQRKCMLKQAARGWMKKDSKADKDKLFRLVQNGKNKDKLKDEQRAQDEINK